MLQCMDLNVSSMSESLAISLALEWKILLSILVLQSKINIVRTLNFFSSLKNYFNLFLVIDLGLISCNSGSKRFKTPTLQRSTQLSEERDCMILTYFLLHRVLLEKYKVIRQLF